MKQTLRKILAVLVVFSIVLSLGLVALSGSASAQEFFYDPFEDGDLNGWSSNTVGTNGVFENGALVVPAGRGANKVITNGASELTNYSVEAKIQLHQGHLTATPPSTISVSIVGRAGTIGTSGYEFGLRYNHADAGASLGVALIARDGSGGANVIKKTSSVKKVLGVDYADPYAQYTLKMVMDGSTITCYVNGAKAFDYVNTTFTKGFPGTTASGTGFILDDYKVVTFAEGGSASSEVSSAASSDVSSATSSAPALGDGVYVKEDFTDDSKFAAEGWDTNPTILDGKAVNTANKTYMLSKNTVVSALQDYVVEAEVFLDLSQETEDPTIRQNVFAGIVGRGSYQMRLCWKRGDQKGYIMAHNGTTIKAATIKSNVDLTVAHKLKMVFAGATVYYYLDDELIKTYTGETPVAGTAGLNAIGYAATYDNFVVRAANQYESSGEKAPYFFEDFDSDANFASGGWNTTPNSTNKMYKVVSSMNDLRKNTVVSALSDYAVEADIKIDTTTNSSVNTSVTGITARMENGAGYELMLRFDKSGVNNIRIYNRRSDASVAMIADNIMRNQLEGNKSYRLKMVLDGATLKCFVDGALVYVTAATDAVGTVGVRSFGYAGYFDNFTVRDATQAELSATMSGDTSSDTSSGNTSSGSTSSGGTSSGNTSSLPEGVYFQEDFNDQLLKTDGWQANVGVTNGKYVKPATVSGTSVGVSNHSVLSTLTNYVVEAKVTVDETVVFSNYDNSIAAIYGRNDGTGGVEFGIYYTHSTGKRNLRFFDRKAGASTIELIPYEWESGKEYTLKILFQDSTIKLFIDDTIVAEYHDQTPRAGYVGFMNNGMAGYFDDMVVRVATTAELNATTGSGDTSSGTSSGGTSSFEPFTPPAGTIFYEDFNDKLKQTDGWDKNASVSPEGKYSAAGVYLTNHATIKAMSDYAIDVEVCVPDVYGSTSVGTNVTALVGRYTTIDGVMGGYEIGYVVERDSKNTYLRVYDRIQKKGTTFANVSFMHGVTYKITALFLGETLRIYINGEAVAEMKVANRAGTVGIIRTGYIAYFDNLVVRTPSADEINPPVPDAPEADANGVYYKDSFSDPVHLLNSLWSSEFDNVDQGRLVLQSNGVKTYFISGDKGFTQLQNYTVEAKISIDASVAASKNDATITLMGHLNGELDGFEFGLAVNGNKTYARLYNRALGVTEGITAETLFTNTQIKLERNKQYTLRMVFSGETVYCYIDQEKVFEVKGTASLKGTAGLRVDGLKAWADDFVIRKATAAELKGEGGNSDYVGGGTVNNPTTGDSVLYLCVAFCVLLAAGLVLQLTKRQRAK